MQPSCMQTCAGLSMSRAGYERRSTEGMHPSMRGAFTRLTAARVAQRLSLTVSMEQGQSVSQRDMACVACNAHVGPEQHMRA